MTEEILPSEIYEWKDLSLESVVEIGRGWGERVGLWRLVPSLLRGFREPTYPPLWDIKRARLKVLGERLLGRCWEAGLTAVFQAAVGSVVSLCCGAFSRRRAKSAALCSEIQARTEGKCAPLRRFEAGQPEHSNCVGSGERPARAFASPRPAPPH